MTRKTPVLLREGPLSKRIHALTRYTRKQAHGREVIQAALDGKHDVTADFDALVCELLLKQAPNIAAILDGAAKGFDLTPDECKEIARFRYALVEIIERHNSGPHVKR